MTDKLDRMRANRLARREQLAETLNTTRNRLRPANLASELVGRVRVRATEVAEDAATAVRARPKAAAGVLAAAALFLLRKPIIGALRRLTKEK